MDNLSELIEKKRAEAEAAAIDPNYVDHIARILFPNHKFETPLPPLLNSSDSESSQSIVQLSRRSGPRQFSLGTIKSAFSYIYARLYNLDIDPIRAFKSINVAAVARLFILLHNQGASDTEIAACLTRMSAGYINLKAGGGKAITKGQYDLERERALKELGRNTDGIPMPWPPTSQTLMKWLGDGYWNDLLSQMHIETTKVGRARGGVSYSKEQYLEAVRDFIDHQRRSNASEAFLAYSKWAKAEKAAGRPRPSGAAIRQHFNGAWNAAKDAVNR